MGPYEASAGISGEEAQPWSPLIDGAIPASLAALRPVSPETLPARPQSEVEGQTGHHPPGHLAPGEGHPRCSGGFLQGVAAGGASRDQVPALLNTLATYLRDSRHSRPPTGGAPTPGPRHSMARLDLSSV